MIRNLRIYNYSKINNYKINPVEKIIKIKDSQYHNPEINQKKMSNHDFSKVLDNEIAKRRTK